MRRTKLFFIFIISIIFSIVPVKAAEAAKAHKGVLKENYTILEPCNKKINGYPLLEEMKDNSKKKIVSKLFKNSFMKESVHLYYLVQNYLIKMKKQKDHEPAYLLISNNDGGFPQKGFYLKTENKIINKTKTHYIELVKYDKSDESYLGSMTQIYPHEMGHVIFSMLCPKADIDVQHSINMHYFGLTTEPATAFNEGFATHFQRVAIKNEPSATRKIKIIKDIKAASEELKPKIRGYERDFKWPLRLGYYRLGMLSWYQNLESLKRVQGKNIINATNALDSNNLSDSILYRNANVTQNPKLKRSAAAMLSTEGIISTFFNSIIESKLKGIYLNNDFYDNNYVTSKPAVSQLENEYLKIFIIFNKYLNKEDSRFQILEFIKGYSNEFPKEKNQIYKIFTDATGGQIGENEIYKTEIPEIWMLNKNFNNAWFAMDQFITMPSPIYTFDLNCADVIDLLTLKGMKENQAKIIINYRNKNKFIDSINDLKRVNGISKKTIDILKQSRFNKEYFNHKMDNVARVSISKLIIGDLVQFLLRTFYVFIIFMSIFLLLNRNKLKEFKMVVKLAILKLLKTYLISALALFSIFAVKGDSKKFYLVCIFLIIIFEITITLFRKDKRKGKQAIASSIIISSIILYSLV